MEYDDVFQFIGESGLYQILLYILVGLPSFFGGPINIIPNFAGYTQQHWCYVEQLQNYPHDWQKYVAIPYVDGNPAEYDSCLVYDLDYANLTDDVIRNWNRSLSISEETETVECDAWVYDQSEFVSTIVSDVRMLCMQIDEYAKKCLCVIECKLFISTDRLHELLMIFCIFFTQERTCNLIKNAHVRVF